MFTRSQYLNRECSHREYYNQFVTDYMKRELRSLFLNKILESKDEYMNDIPLHRWDRIGYIANNFHIRRMMRERMDYLTNAGIVCILKEAAKQIKEEDEAYRDKARSKV